MAKYRIISKGNTAQYRVQKKVYNLFWVTLVGEHTPLTADEANTLFEKYRALEQPSRVLRTEEF